MGRQRARCAGEGGRAPSWLCCLSGAPGFGALDFPESGWQLVTCPSGCLRSDSDLPDDSQQGRGRFLGESVGSDPGRELAERSSGASETALFLARPLLSVTWSHPGRWSVSTKSALPRAMPPSRSFGLYSAPQQTSAPPVPGAVRSPGGHDPCPLWYRGRAGKMK